MPTPRFLVKSDQAGDMLMVTDESRVHRSGGEAYQYSDEAKAADAATKKALARKPKQPERPSREEHQKAGSTQEQYTAAWDEWSKANAEWNRTVYEPLRAKHHAAGRKAFDARIKATPTPKIRVDVGDNIPGQAGNQSKRVRRLTALDARALDRLERRISALQAERATLIWEAFARADRLTPDDVVAMADLPDKKKMRLPRPVYRTDLDGIHTITSRSAAQRLKDVA